MTGQVGSRSAGQRSALQDTGRGSGWRQVRRTRIPGHKPKCRLRWLQHTPPLSGAPRASNTPLSIGAGPSEGPAAQSWEPRLTHVPEWPGRERGPAGTGSGMAELGLSLRLLGFPPHSPENLSQKSFLGALGSRHREVRPPCGHDAICREQSADVGQGPLKCVWGCPASFLPMRQRL